MGPVFFETVYVSSASRPMPIVSWLNYHDKFHERVCVVKPKFHYADFRRNFPAGKVVDKNHESRRRGLCRRLS